MHYYVIRKISLIITFHCETASCSESPDPSSFSPPPFSSSPFLLREGSGHARLLAAVEKNLGVAWGRGYAWPETDAGRRGVIGYCEVHMQETYSFSF